VGLVVLLPLLVGGAVVVLLPVLAGGAVVVVPVGAVDTGVVVAGVVDSGAVATGVADTGAVVTGTVPVLVLGAALAGTSTLDEGIFAGAVLVGAVVLCAGAAVDAG